MQISLRQESFPHYPHKTSPSLSVGLMEPVFPYYAIISFSLDWNSNTPKAFSPMVHSPAPFFCPWCINPQELTKANLATVFFSFPFKKKKITIIVYFLAAINCSDKLTLKSQKKTVGGFSRVKKTTTLFSIIEGNIGEQVSKKTAKHGTETP